MQMQHVPFSGAAGANALTSVMMGDTPVITTVLAIRAEMEKPADILRAMYVVNPRLCALEGRIGTLVPGAAADIVLTRVNPLEAIAALAEGSAVERVFHRGRPAP